MLYLLLGQDDFGKRQYLQKAHQESGAGESRVFSAEDENLSWSILTSQDLFSKSKTFILESCFKQLEKQDAEPDISALMQSPNHIFILEEKLDKRIGLSKKLLAAPGVKTVQFDLPHQGSFDAWIMARAKELGGNMSAAAANLLAKKLGRDDFQETKVQGRVVDVREVFSLWQADAEIRKLISLAAGEEIGQAEVEDIVHAEIEVDSIEIANAIADNDRRQALSLVDQFLTQAAGADHKAGVIQLSALLAEQFRNIAAVQDFTARKLPEAKILEITGWKPGRLFVVKKIASRFAAPKVLQTLLKLEALDTELKTSSTPPRVLLDLILSQLLMR